MAMGRKSNSFRETYLQVVALMKTLHLLHVAELTEAARSAPAGEMVTGSGPRMKPPITETLQDFDLKDDYVPEHPEQCDPEQPDDCDLAEEDHMVREDAVPVAARCTTAGGWDWRDEALDEVRSMVLKHIQPGDAGYLERNNVVIDRTNDKTFGFQIGMAVRKVCEQFTLEKTNRLILLDSVSRQEEEAKKFKAQNEELQMRLSESVSRHEEVTKKVKAQNEELRMSFAESIRRQEEEINNLKAQNEKLLKRFSESVSRQEEVIKDLTAEKEELQCKLIDNFLALRPQRPLCMSSRCDSMCSNSFRISAINEPGNSALSTHEYRAGFVDQTPLVVEKKDQPAGKHPKHVQALETLPTNDSPPIPQSLKRKRTTRFDMQTRETSASEIFAVEHLTSVEEHVEEARQLLFTDRSPMPTAASSEHDNVMRVDHAAPHHGGQRCHRKSVEGCDNTTWRLKRIFGQQGKKTAPNHRHLSPWHEDVQSVEPSRSKPRPRVYKEYVCGIGDNSRKGTPGAMWKPWESHNRGKPANKWWDCIWVQDGGRRQRISRLRNMDMNAAHNKHLMRQDELKSSRTVQLQKQKRCRNMINSRSQFC